MSNRTVNGKTVSNDFALYEFPNGGLIDLSSIAFIRPSFTESKIHRGYELMVKGRDKCLQVPCEFYDGLVSAWIDYKCAQDIGFRLDNIENTLRVR